MNSLGMSAPGKAVVCGEYAVLAGAPAIAMAVNRRAGASLQRTDNDCHRVELRGHQDAPVEFRFDDSAGIAIVGRARPLIDLDLIRCIWSAVSPATTESIDFRLDTSSFFDRERQIKLGLGSSAALAVALTAALLRLCDDRQDPGPVALAAHRQFQGGNGSGVDIAVAVHGGVLAYRSASGLAIERLHWPAGLRFLVLWSGQAASTASRLRRLAAYADTGSGRDSAAGLQQASADVLDAWRTGAGAAVLDALKEYCAVLQRFSDDRDLGVFDAGHRELHELANRRGLLYKPCGAGGGDIGIVLGTRQGDLEDFAGRATSFGFSKLDVALDSRGLEESADK
jgi:phosphomevalonate kinase